MRLIDHGVKMLGLTIPPTNTRPALESSQSPGMGVSEGGISTKTILQTPPDSPWSLRSARLTLAGQLACSRSASRDHLAAIWLACFEDAGLRLHSLGAIRQAIRDFP